MALSSLAKLQIIRTLMIILVSADVLVTTSLFLRLGSSGDVGNTIVHQVSYNN